LNFGPFSSQLDQSYYYAFSSFEQRLHILQRLVQGNDFLIFVIGKFGSGKTFLLRRFLDSSDEDWRTCRIRTRITVPSAKSLPMDNLNKHPAYILQENQIPIILFDDAHRLTNAELKYLLQDALAPSSHRKLKRLVLFCEPQILSTMEDLSKAINSATAINKIYMPPLTRTETAAYLWHRLTTAGFSGKNPFQDSIVKKIHRASGGLPGRINEEAIKHLQKRKSGYTSILDIFRIDNFTSKRSWIWVCAGMVVFALAFLVMSPNLILPLYSPKQQVSANSIRILKKKIKKSSLPSIRADQFIKPKQSSKTAAGAEMVHKRVYRETWLLQQNPAFYTIQIIGVRNEKELWKFIENTLPPHQIPIAYYQTKFKGSPWYPLLYGIYPTRKQALSAIQNLPKDIQKLSPWMRKLSAVQKSVKKNMKR
jgi:type II secretory pathway predicted ATPase ExeA